MSILINVFMLLTILAYVNYLMVKNANVDKSLFENKYSKLLYILSYTFPLNIFLKESEELSAKEKKIEEQLIKLNLTDFFNLRSFMALRFMLFLFSIVAYIGIVSIIKALNGINFSLGNTFIWLAILLLISFLPDLYLKKKEIEFKRFYYDEVIILQLFMILLIKSDSTVEDILFSFSKMKTFHKATFEKAYRISIRNKSEALAFLEDKFKDMRFGSSFNALMNLSDFSRGDIVRILETNLRVMEEDSINDKRKNELTKFSYSQMSVVVPFMVVIFLGAIPLINYGVNIMMESIQGL